VIAKNRNYPRQAEFPSFNKFLKALREAFWAIMVPVIIMGGIYGGVFTPTEAAVAASVYALLVGKFIYRELDARKIYDAFKDAMTVNAATTFMIGLSTSFAAYLAMERIPIKVGNIIMAQADSKVLVFLLINAMFLVVGCFVDNISSTIILTPIFLPVVTKLGMSPIQYGIMMTFALAIGFVTPPYGCNLFVASAISGEKVETISKYLIPFIIVMVLVLGLFTFIPSLSTALLPAGRY
jgi:C4-dicarboxylate transporter DctM subunit